MEFKVIELSDPDWDTYIEASYLYDFHHTSCFHEIELKENEKSVMFLGFSNNEHICLPLVMKKIPNSDYFDATSVYGYCGPIASKPIELLKKNLLDFFKKEFLNFCYQNKIISVFSRLHPLIPQKHCFENFGKVIELNKTVAIDLTLPVAEQRRSYRKSNKSEINQLKGKKGYVFEKIENTDKESIREFVDIYLSTMKKVKAKPYYFFDFNYFQKLLNNECFECDLLVTRKDNVIVAGAIFTRTNAIMQYHLSGTKEEFLRDTPMKLILDEARLLGSKNKLKFLHLGGGVGGSDKDSLFHFKSGFSKNFYQFRVWNLIVNENIYQKLVEEKNLRQQDFPDFFPLYRSN